jgi:hypothetical protein
VGLYDYGLLVLRGRADYGSYSAADAALVEGFVSQGGSLLYIDWGAEITCCDAVDSMLTNFGVVCAGAEPSTGGWAGIATDIVLPSHPVTTGVGEIHVNGLAMWSVSAPSEVAVNAPDWPVVAVAEVDLGRFVGSADEWPFYNAGHGTADISAGDNETYIQNIWTWLIQFPLD